MSSDWFLKSLFDLVSLFTNLIGRGIYLNNVHLFLDDTCEEGIETKVDYYFNQIAKPHTENHLSSFQMPFPYNIIKDEFNEFVSSWFQNKKSLSAIYDILYSDFHSENYLEMDYINIIYGLEGYHRINHSNEGKYVNKATYRNYLKEIRESLSKILIKEETDELFERLSSIIGTSNEISLRTRIIKLLDSIEDLDLKNELFELSSEEIRTDSELIDFEKEISLKIAVFAKTVTSLRNSLTHIDFDEKKVGIEIDYDKIFEYKKKLKRLLLFHVFHSCGLPQKFVLERIKQSKYL